MEEPLPENIRGGSSQVHRERNLLTKPSYRIFLQNGISECVYQRIQLFAGFAERAGAVVIVGIIRHISFAEYGADRNVIYLVHGTENGRYSLQQAAVILDTFDGLIAVSYTHLDVYKRQAADGCSGCGDWSADSGPAQLCKSIWEDTGGGSVFNTAAAPVF